MRSSLLKQDVHVESKLLPAAGPSGIVRTLHILRDRFDSRLEPSASNIFTRRLLTRRVQAHFAVSLNYNETSAQYNLKITSVVIDLD